MSNLTATGFKKKLFNEIQTDLQNNLRETFGALNFSDESVIGQIIGINAEAISQLWDVLEAVYNSQYPDTATGISLDNVCSVLGMTRLQSTATRVPIIVTGTNNLLIQAGNQITTENGTASFSIDEDITVSSSNFVNALLSIQDADVGSVYSVIINNIEYNYEKEDGDTNLIILNALIGLINAAEIGVTASNKDNMLYIASDDFNISREVFCSVENMDIETVSSLGKATCLVLGAILAPINSLTVIQTPIFGWSAVTNPSDGITGRNLETDNELRFRRSRDIKLPGTSSLDAIQARLSNIPGVSLVQVLTNRENTEVDGMPPHSIQALVVGGDPQNIGDELWKVIPGGIQTYGDIEVIIYDSNNKPQTMYFSRPENLYIYVQVALVFDGSGTYPADGDAKIKAGILAQITSLSVNEDVIIQSLFKSIYSVPGISNVFLTIGGSTSSTVAPTLSNTNIDVGNSQVATTDLNKINVIID